MHLPTALHDSIAARLGTNIQNVQVCSGGDINEAAQIVTSDGSLFVKWHPRSPQHMFSTEAKGLSLLRKSNTVRVPEVIMVEEARDDCPAYILLEWLESGTPQAHTSHQLGEQLAALHQQSASEHGLDHDNFIGRLPQYNHQHATWAAFYAEQRIRPQMKIAQQVGQLPTHREKLLNTLLQRLDTLLPQPNPPASLLHGDLWGGNFMTLTGGQPAVIDPAVYYGHREIEMAFTELFGGFSPAFYDAYNSVYPLDKEYQRRKSLYQLYPLMVHMNLFGGGYGRSVDSILRQYVS